MSDIALEFDNVWKKFRRGEMYDSLRDLIPAVARNLFRRPDRAELGEREFWALREISFQVRHGEALGIIGANGAGKSTALKLLSRILTATGGRVQAYGRLSALIEVAAGFHPDLTGRENVYLNGTILGMKRQEIARKFDEIVEFAGIGSFIDTPVKRYSSGMYARLGFAVAAHVEPEILVVDEVLSVGDMPFQEKCFERMRQVVRNGTAVIFVSHNLQAVQALCPRSLLLEKGCMTASGDTRDVITRYVRAAQGEQTTGTGGPLRVHGLGDQRGDPVEEFKPGERAHLVFSLDASVPIAECILAFIIQRLSDGQYLCDYNLSLASAPPPAAIALDGGTRSIEFEVNLLRGAYGVLLNLYHAPTSRFLARHVHAGVFTVGETVSYGGIAHLNPRWQAARLSQAASTR